MYKKEIVRKISQTISTKYLDLIINALKYSWQDFYMPDCTRDGR